MTTPGTVKRKDTDETDDEVARPSFVGDAGYRYGSGGTFVEVCQLSEIALHKVIGKAVVSIGSVISGSGM